MSLTYNFIEHVESNSTLKAIEEELLKEISVLSEISETGNLIIKCSDRDLNNFDENINKESNKIIKVEEKLRFLNSPNRSSKNHAFSWAILLATSLASVIFLVLFGFASYYFLRWYYSYVER